MTNLTVPNIVLAQETILCCYKLFVTEEDNPENIFNVPAPKPVQSISCNVCWSPLKTIKLTKNPAYGRYQLFRPMRIVDLTQILRGCIIYPKKKCDQTNLGGVQI